MYRLSGCAEIEATYLSEATAMFNAIKIYLLGTLACLTILCTLWLLTSFTQTSASMIDRRDDRVTTAMYQQDVDHFSNDARAMSPRDWGSVDASSAPPQPEVSFDPPLAASAPPPLDESTLYENARETQMVDRDQQSEFRPVEYGTVRQPKNFYESQPLRIEPGESGAGNSSPLPLQPNTSPSSNQPALGKGNPFVRRQPRPRPQSNSNTEKFEKMPLESRMETYRGPANAQGISSDEVDNQRYSVPQPTYDEMVYGQNRPYAEQGQVESGYDCHDAGSCSSCPMPDSTANVYAPRYTPPSRARRQQRRAGHRNAGHRNAGHQSAGQNGSVSSRSRRCSHCRLRKGAAAGPQSIAMCQCDEPMWMEQPCDSTCDPLTAPCSNGNAGCESCGPDTGSSMTFNPSLGFRSDRMGHSFSESSADVFSFEENEQYPSMREILAQSIYFAEADFMFLQPAFGGNAAISSGTPGNIVADPFNFDLEPAFRVMAGYESEFGPGLVGEYFQFDNNSDLASFTSDGIQSGETSVYQLGSNAWTRLAATNPGETLDALHSLEVHSTSVYAFKAIKFKRASVNGRFGLQIASIQQTLDATLTDAGGNELGRLRNNSEVNAFGPRFGIDYFRRIGHTPLQLVSSATGAILFGDRDQQVSNSWTGESSSLGADEFITHFDIFFGLQMRRYRGEKRNTTMRLGFVNQSWIGGGTAIDPNDDFGFQGVSITMGFNR